MIQSSVVMLGVTVMLRMMVMIVEGRDVEEGSALEIMVLLRRVLKLGMRVMLK